MDLVFDDEPEEQQVSISTSKIRKGYESTLRKHEFEPEEEKVRAGSNKIQVSRRTYMYAEKQKYLTVFMTNNVGWSYQSLVFNI